MEILNFFQKKNLIRIDKNFDYILADVEWGGG